MNENNYIKRFLRGVRILEEMTYFNYKGDIKSKQNKMLNAMLKYAVTHCKYYRNIAYNSGGGDVLR